MTDKSEKMEKGTVATGHTIDIPVGRRVVGYDKEAHKEVFGPVWKSLKPGEPVELPADEFKRLQALGFIHDLNKFAPADTKMARNESR